MKIINNINRKIKTPKFIKVGDPTLFCEFNKDKDRMNNLVYVNDISDKKDWVCEVTVTEVDSSYETFGGNMVIKNNIDYCIYIAGSEYDINNLKDANYNEYTDYKSMEIRLDTGNYIFNINNNSQIDFNTDSNGSWGEIKEYYRDTELIGITFNMAAEENVSFKDTVTKIFTLFETI